MSTTTIRYQTIKLATAMQWMRVNWDGDKGVYKEFEKNALSPFQESWDSLDEAGKNNLKGWIQGKINSAKKS